MRTRVIVALSLLPLLFIVLYALPPWCLPVAEAVVAVMGVWELLVGTKFVKNPRVAVWACAFAAYVPFQEYFRFGGFVLYGAFFIYVCVLFAEGMLNIKETGFGVIGAAFLSSVLLSGTLTSISRVVRGEFGYLTVLFIFIIPFLTDIFALIVGSAMGKHKLAPVISPKKSVEGAVGGLAASVFFCAVYGAVLTFGFGLEVNWLSIAVTALLASAVGQFGDLCFSYIKRGLNVKDYGTTLPGHGGILDRFDSLFFAAPAVEFCFLLLPVVRI